ncbi:hypothetical protein PF005_g12404 [Phytophthora fragariae]|uniref:FYVE-type domain-containing protein n=1 Tax=Phytophthora fragariae TaxID=53985 RepID=A0A6A3S5G6_9STRA|nr:hypothetical protein PF003_g13044 [Phytophthora fragariae]KAE9109831.1 hypothetical protein PF007_g12086 [Phytophthora fragariae]KAE9143368.1 hypothetical protein PF006_g11584 [Phytophthora fragariae]KAE9207919.1 hypothetical protein PF005_g12404 [Phytophthora fragariae]KAE9230120.1 hypothetical protein PF004_g10569 [Phytophthora fragariae]
MEDYVNKYEEFVLVNRRKVDERRWEYVKSKDKLRVYSERTRKELSRWGMQPETSLSATQRVQAKAVTKELPVVMSVGSFVGELDDLMFGVVNPTLNDMRIKASYVHNLETAAVVCPVLEPTKDDPFRSLVIKWMTIDVPLPSSLIKSRDFVYIEATGMTFLSNGDRIGYHLQHSIDFPQTKPLPNKIRGNMSVFSCFRRKRRQVLENFAWGVVDPGGEIMRSLAVSVAAGTLLTATNYVYCGQMKKLAWMLELKRSTDSPIDREYHTLQRKQCVVCGKKTTNAIGSIGKGTCKICDGSVCYSCKIRQRVSRIVRGGQLVQRKVVVCAKCMIETNRWSAQEAAVDHALGYEFDTMHSAYSFVDTSASSLEELT